MGNESNTNVNYDHGGSRINKLEIVDSLIIIIYNISIIMEAYYENKIWS